MHRLTDTTFISPPHPFFLSVPRSVHLSLVRAVGQYGVVENEVSLGLLLDNDGAQDENDLWKDAVAAPQVDGGLDCTFAEVFTRCFCLALCFLP